MGNSRMCTYMAMQFFNSNLEFLNKHYLNLCCCIISGIRKRSQRNILKPVKCIRNAVNMAQSPISPQILHCLSSVFMINVKVSLKIKRQNYALNKRKTDYDMPGKLTNRKFDCTYFPPYCVHTTFGASQQYRQGEVERSSGNGQFS